MDFMYSSNRILQNISITILEIIKLSIRILHIPYTRIKVLYYTSHINEMIIEIIVLREK